jgi:hypothetical protein
MLVVSAVFPLNGMLRGESMTSTIINRQLLRYLWAVAALILILPLAGCAENDVNKSLDSPDGKYTAYAFIRNSGATVDFIPCVSVYPKGTKFGDDNDGNVFRGYHSDFIDIEWADANTLIVYHDVKDEDVFMKLDMIFDIEIIYQLK